MLQWIKSHSAIFVIIAVMIAVSSEGAENYPKPAGAINDFAGVIQSQDRNRMEALAREVLEKTGTSIVLATMQTIGDNDPDEYANKLYEAWGIGKKGEDKGVLIFLTLKERKIRIETGYGVEGILPDGLVGEILDKSVLPYLKEGDFSKGLVNALVAISSVVAKNANVSLTGSPTLVQSKTKNVRRNRGGYFQLILLIIAIFFLIGTRPGRTMLPWILLMMLGGSGGRGGGFGGFGGGGFGGFGGGGSGGGGASRGF